MKLYSLGGRENWKRKLVTCLNWTVNGVHAPVQLASNAQSGLSPSDSYFIKEKSK